MASENCGIGVGSVSASGANLLNLFLIKFELECGDTGGGLLMGACGGGGR